jgi:hypothetical protein
MIKTILVIWLILGVASAIIGSNKGRSGCVWLLVGLILGPIGLILVLLAPRTRPPV